MDTVTYPQPQVAAELAAHFACARVDITSDREAMRQARVLWTPWLVCWSRHQIPLRTVIGFLPPAQLLIELRFVRALDALRRAEYERARSLFSEVADAADAAELAPEAAYWVGIAGYLRDGDDDRLHDAWRPLQERWPTSTWAARTRYPRGRQP